MIFKKEGTNWIRTYEPIKATTETIVEAYMQRSAKPKTVIKEQHKTSYTLQDLELWKDFGLDNEILLDERDDAQMLSFYKIILGHLTEWVEEGDVTSLIPIGEPALLPDDFVKLMLTYLDQRRQISEGYCSKKAIASWLDVSVPTVDRLMKEGIPYKKLGTRVLFSKTQVDNFLNS